MIPEFTPEFVKKVITVLFILIVGGVAWEIIRKLF